MSIANSPIKCTESRNGGITMKIYRITTITDHGSRFVRTVQADSKLEAIARAYSELAGNENIASVEEV